MNLFVEIDKRSIEQLCAINHSATKSMNAFSDGAIGVSNLLCLLIEPHGLIIHS